MIDGEPNKEGSVERVFGCLMEKVEPVIRGHEKAIQILTEDGEKVKISGISVSGQTAKQLIGMLAEKLGIDLDEGKVISSKPANLFEPGDVEVITQYGSPSEGMLILRKEIRRRADGWLECGSWELVNSN